MKTIKTVAVILLSISSVSVASATTSNIDTEKSIVKWTARKVTGQHTGTIAIKEGSLDVANGKITGGKVVIDMQSIVNLDLTDEGYNAKLIGHLKSDDFFSVATYPTSELVITKVENNADVSTITGNLTIKGITNPVTFTATASKDGEGSVFKGTMIVDRSKYNVRYGSKSFFNDLGDKVIYDDFTLDFSIVMAK